MRIGERWQLRAGGRLLADLVVTGADQPWLLARFVPTPDFESVRGLFDESLRLSESVADKGGWAAWQRAYDRILDAVSLSVAHRRRHRDLAVGHVMTVARVIPSGMRGACAGGVAG